METAINPGLVSMIVGGCTFALVAIIITLAPWFVIGYFLERKMLYSDFYELFSTCSFYLSLTIGVVASVYLFGYFGIFDAISSYI